ncbi:MAG: hypothetical protein NXY57DRAFT_639881 [Lentinula lateritia]|uniref:HMG box domain-containing protein n=1 Tax=Lentinula lateritia TaxID=40482 RepID=A0ABQ8V9R2_9AGAR|nr:MAG: hypothetical protein NXY57DRAFT_639881 [Lentinula lateritia]KAJ4482707.1 hypothetical protein C8R41DRAFT_841220 [Lentinula lateritia]
MTSKEEPSADPYNCTQRTESSSASAVPVSLIHAPSPSVPRIRFPVDCDLAHYYQDIPHPSTASSPPLCPIPTPPLSSPSPPPSNSQMEHIPRPPNAFMLFRSDFSKRDVIPPSVEKRQQTLSQVAGEVWNLMPVEEKRKWHTKSAEALKLHTEKYPNYKFSPVRRGSGRRSKVKVVEDDDTQSKDRIREIRETYLHMRGPAIAPLRRRRGRQHASTSEDEKTGTSSKPFIDQLPVSRLETQESNLFNPREPALPPLFPRPTYPHLLANRIHSTDDMNGDYEHYPKNAQYYASTVEDQSRCIPFNQNEQRGRRDPYHGYKASAPYTFVGKF